jgi:PleD family two-component response regulator
VADIKQSILIVEDDVDVAEMLDAYFRVQGYDATTVHWGEDAITACRKSRPDLVILDIRLPDIDGFEVARQLREARRTENIPIIFLTEKRGRLDILQGLELGADDYITKPFDIQELRLRVRNALNRANQGTISNPVTGLPEGSWVDEKLAEILAKGAWTVMLTWLENLDRFRDVYGFVAADDVLRAVSLMFVNAVRDVGTTSDFVGHLGVDGFVVVSETGSLDGLRERIETRLEQSLAYFYPVDDRPEDASRIEERLAVRMKVVTPGDRSFRNLDDFKNFLLSV